MAEKIQWLSPERLGVGVGDSGMGGTKRYKYSNGARRSPGSLLKTGKPRVRVSRVGSGVSLRSIFCTFCLVMAFLFFLMLYAANSRDYLNKVRHGYISSDSTLHSITDAYATAFRGSARASGNTAAARSGASKKSSADAIARSKLNPGDEAYPVGYMLKPKLVRGAAAVDSNIHIIFSSGCNYFQHWQSEMLLASAHFQRQPGRITRIVSGCHDKSAEKVNHQHQTFPQGKNDLIVPVEVLKRSVNPNFGLYITPSFPGAKDFPWINKPTGINHFLQKVPREVLGGDDTVIVILDPDFQLVTPITLAPLDVDDMISSRHPLERGMNVVKRGRPVGQRYGLEGGWVGKFKHANIVPEGSPALDYSSREAAKHFSVGPPYMLHIDDAQKLSPLWSDYMQPVLTAGGPDILADMWAYCMAAAHLGLRHVQLDQYMVSTWGGGEGQRWIENLDSYSCRNPAANNIKRLPNFIHLASNFKAPESKEWMFHKGHVPADILACGTPLIKEAPDDLYAQSKSKNRKQCAWVICETVRTINRVASTYKQMYCDEGEAVETRKMVKLIQSKTRDRGCSQSRDKWCYPLAQVEEPDD